MNAHTGFLNPMSALRQNPMRASFINNNTPKLASVERIKRINSLTKKSSLSAVKGKKKSSINRNLNTSLLDVRVEPLRCKMTREWESSSEESKPEEPIISISPVKITTMEQFFEQRKSRMNPINIMLEQK